jgi:hypothetical protein
LGLTRERKKERKKEIGFLAAEANYPVACNKDSWSNCPRIPCPRLHHPLGLIESTLSIVDSYTRIDSCASRLYYIMIRE